MHRFFALMTVLLALLFMPSVVLLHAQASAYSSPWPDDVGSASTTLCVITPFGCVSSSVGNSANARGWSRPTSIGIWAYSVAWMGGAGAIAYVSQGIEYTAPTTGTYSVDFSYQADGNAQTLGADPGLIVSLAGGLIQDGFVGFMQAAGESLRDTVIGNVFQDLLNAHNYGVQAFLVFSIGGHASTYGVYSESDWAGSPITWQPQRPISASVSDRLSVYMQAGNTYDVSAVLTVWTAGGAAYTSTVGSLIELTGPGLTDVSITPPNPLSVTLTVNPLSGQAPFTPSWTFTWNGGQPPVMASMNYGDGTVVDVSSCGNNCPSHTYYNPGTFTITVTVTDSANDRASASQTVTVSAPAPPTCTGGQYWNGQSCVCPSGETWNGSYCVSTPSPPPPSPPSNNCGGGIAVGKSPNDQPAQSTTCVTLNVVGHAPSSDRGSPASLTSNVGGVMYASWNGGSTEASFGGTMQVPTNTYITFTVGNYQSGLSFANEWDFWGCEGSTNQAGSNQQNGASATYYFASQPSSCYAQAFFDIYA